MFRVLVVIVIGTLSGALSQIFMRRGMQIVGSLESYWPLDLITYFVRAVLQPNVIAGTLLSFVTYLCILAALSWTDVTVVFPLTALEYGFGALLAVMILKEVVSPVRWAGITFVIIGVILISATGRGDTGAKHPDDTAKLEEGTYLEK